MTTIRPRSIADRFAILLRVVATAVFFLGLSRAVGWRWALLATVLAGAIIGVALRSKGAPAEGATWSASADLLRRGQRFPGQLSFSDEDAIWTPSSSSERRGVTAVRVPLDKSVVQLSAGSALLDVIVRITADGNAEPLEFLTHRSARLRAAARNLRDSR